MSESPSPGDVKLDALLQTWSRDRSADPVTLDQLQQAISRSIIVPAPQRGSRNPRAIVAVCAVAASLLIAVFAGFHASTRHDGSARVAADRGPVARTKLADLWNETGRLFGPDLNWLCDLDGELLLGIESAVDSPSPGDRVCLSLTLRVFDSTKHEWVDSWTGRISCRGGSTVDFASADLRSAGSIWVQSRPDGRFAVSHWLSWRDHPEMSGSIDTTVSSDKPQVVAEGVADGQRIQVVQQVWRPDVG